MQDAERTHFPKNKRPTGIKDNDILFLAVVSYDRHGREVPVVIGYANVYGYTPSNKSTDDEIRRWPWQERFPHYVEYKTGKFLNVPIKYGISLVDLYTDIGSNTYPSTMGRMNVDVEDVYQIHKRRSHLRITRDAKEYLHTRLEQLFNQYSYVEV